MKAEIIGKAIIVRDHDRTEIDRFICSSNKQAADFAARINAHEGLVAALKAIRDKLNDEYSIAEWTDQGISDEGDTVFGYVYKPEAAEAAVSAINAILAAVGAE